MFIYIKYGELVLKGKNKKVFINKLYENIRLSLKNFSGIKIKKEYDNTKISVANEQSEQVINILKQVPGISLIIKAYTSSLELNELSKDILSVLNLNKTTKFKVNTKRTNKYYKLTSMDVSRELGGLLLDGNKNLTVDVNNPELEINVEIHNDTSIFYFEKIKGLGGFPLGVNGKVLVLLSGGIDSPVASHLLMKKGLHVDFLTFITPPHTSPKALEKTEKLVKTLTLDGLLEKPKLFVVKFTNLQHELAHMFDTSYQITIMRRYFFRIARDLAMQYKYDAIATGESLGQVASQTIESMQTIQNAIDDFLVLRPLLSYDKFEIIDIAKKIKTYDISIEPYIDCCALFVPKNPVTKPKISIAKKIEEQLDLANDIYLNILKNSLEIK
jgi:thiamine biosynthesis protein ThiI